MITTTIRNNFILRHAAGSWNIYAPAFAALAAQSPECKKGIIKPLEMSWREYFGEVWKQRPQTNTDENGIAHISVFGVLLNKETDYSIAVNCGTGYEEIVADIDNAQADTKVRGIMLHVDSPGGHAAGNNIVARKISECTKPIFAHSDGLACSAAYAIACGVNHFSATPDATIGSIGTICPMLDVSGLWEQFGIKADYVTNKEGTLKAAGFPPNQTPEEKQSIQDEIEQLYTLFKAYVLEHRALEPDTMRGQAFVGQQAFDKKLCDEICDYSTAYAELVQFVNLTK